MRHKVTIHGRQTRRALTCALWRIVSERVVGEGELSDACFSAGWRAIHAAYALDGDPAEAEYRLARMAILRSAIRTVSRCPEGAEIALPVTAAELEDALLDLIHAIEQNEELLQSLGHEERRDVAGCREAAVRVLAQIRSVAIERELARDLGPGIAVPDFVGPLRASRLRDERTPALSQPRG